MPQGEESYTILYRRDTTVDTLFRPAVNFFIYPNAADSIAPGNGWRAVCIRHNLENGGIIEVIYALPSTAIEQQLKNLSLLIWLVLPLGSVLAFIIAWWLSSRLLKPVSQIIRIANSINLNNDPELLKEPAVNDELKELVVSFNRMLLRIKEQADRQTAFFASASHELRTPLSVMQTRLQVLLHDRNENASVKELYAGQLREVKQLNKMVNDFLLLSELRSGKLHLLMATINLPDFMLELVSRYKEKAAEKSISFKINYLPANENYDVRADAEKLNIIVNNLLENAIKYAPQSTIIACNIKKEGAPVMLEFINAIRSDINPQVSDLKNQFYHSKPIHGEGFGLGLWIANQLAIIQNMELYCAVTTSEQFAATLVINPGG